MKLSLDRSLFWATVAVAGATFWIAQRPPMSDLAQHAAQVAVWHDLLLGTSKWAPLLYINYFTPYLIGYSGALLLSFAMPIAMALKVMLSAAFVGFVAACILLRKRFGGDSRLDWLFVSGFFGYAYVWGFFTFEVAVPLGVLFIYWAHCYADRPTIATGVLLALAEVPLFFSHGFVFLFANAIAVSFLALKHRHVGRLVMIATPYLVAAVVCGLYILIRLPIEHTSSSNGLEIDWEWDLTRLKFLVYPFGAFKADAIFAPVSVLMLMAPLVLGDRFNLRRPMALIPLAFILLAWIFVPSSSVTTAHIYQRMAVFLLPFYALAFCAPTAGQSAAEPSRGRKLLARCWLPLLCWTFLAIHIERHMAFATEASDFESVMAEAQPGYRAVGMIFDTASAATGNLVAYSHFALWYQAEKGGFVDFNIAGYIPMVVRYRPDAAPTIRVGSAWLARNFQWDRDMAGIYRYFFVRSIMPLPTDYFPSGKCKPNLVKAVGSWALYENSNCYSPPA
jgi:hypothetical protein